MKNIAEVLRQKLIGKPPVSLDIIADPISMDTISFTFLTALNIAYKHNTYLYIKPVYDLKSNKRKQKRTEIRIKLPFGILIIPFPLGTYLKYPAYITTNNVKILYETIYPLETRKYFTFLFYPDKFEVLSPISPSAPLFSFYLPALSYTEHLSLHKVDYNTILIRHVGEKPIDIVDEDGKVMWEFLRLKLYSGAQIETELKKAYRSKKGSLFFDISIIQGNTVVFISEEEVQTCLNKIHQLHLEDHLTDILYTFVFARKILVWILLTNSQTPLDKYVKDGVNLYV